jgi:hypothetical protein
MKIKYLIGLVRDSELKIITDNIIICLEEFSNIEIVVANTTPNNLFLENTNDKAVFLKLDLKTTLSDCYNEIFEYATKNLYTHVVLFNSRTKPKLNINKFNIEAILNTYPYADLIKDSEYFFAFSISLFAYHNSGKFSNQLLSTETPETNIEKRIKLDDGYIKIIKNLIL